MNGSSVSNQTYLSKNCEKWWENKSQRREKNIKISYPYYHEINIWAINKEKK